MGPFAVISRYVLWGEKIGTRQQLVPGRLPNCAAHILGPTVFASSGRPERLSSLWRQQNRMGSKLTTATAAATSAGGSSVSRPAARFSTAESIGDGMGGG